MSHDCHETVVNRPGPGGGGGGGGTCMAHECLKGLRGSVQGRVRREGEGEGAGRVGREGEKKDRKGAATLPSRLTCMSSAKDWHK